MSEKLLYTRFAGPTLLETPLLNKGTAFSKQERESFNLRGLLPPRYETLDEQVARADMQFSAFRSPLNKHIWLRAIQDTNETLYFRLVQEHVQEMLPIIYTPTVGDACERFSDIYRSARGLFIAYEDRHQIDDILRSVTKNNRDFFCPCIANQTLQNIRGNIIRVSTPHHDKYSSATIIKTFLTLLNNVKSRNRKIIPQ